VVSIRVSPDLPGARTFDIRSRRGNDFRIFLAVPEQDPGPQGFPVIYLLDGNVTFATAAATLALQSRRPKTTGVSAAVIVGIGYPIDGYLDPVRRTYDYTLPIAASSLSLRPDRTVWPATGGVKFFLEFIADVLKPAVEAQVSIDRTHQSVFGHSFGGLCVLHTLFTRPDLFQTYVAASPSIWFGDGAIIGEMTDFIARPSSVSARRLLVTVGSLEQTHERRNEDSGRQLRHLRTRMVDSVRELVDALGKEAPPKVAVRLKEFEDENHSSVVPAAISRAVRFALEK
jgi:predicted alpha/beta superfamily hydrolase